MQYRKLVKGGDDISVLGYGGIRFPMRNGRVDEQETEKNFLYAIENGVNYFDTGYFYHGGKSEVVIGNIFERNNLRDKVYIADKMPAYVLRKEEQIGKFFDTQLSRLKTDYIDYYLMHMLESMESWEKCKSLGMLEFIDEKKKAGQIRYIGFSYHGSQQDFLSILDDYDWDFCQIQYNYLDENYQAGLAGLKRAYEKDIGVIAMEPLRGGALAKNMPDKVLGKFAEYDKDRSAADWALRWVFNHEEMCVVLSGMTNKSDVEENCKVASETTKDSMTKQEINIVNEVKEIYRKLMKVPCTGCGYCMPCPYGVQIPTIFSEYNNKNLTKNPMMRYQYIGRAVGLIGGEKTSARDCVGCGKCEQHCPQGIEIRKELKKADRDLNNAIYRAGLSIYASFSAKNKPNK